MSPGLALLIGVLIGAAVVYFWMQTRLQRRTAALQESRDRLTALEQAHRQQLDDLRAELDAAYQRQITLKIERSQDEYVRQLAALEAEYEARLAVVESMTEGSHLTAMPSDDPAPPPEAVEPSPRPAAPLPDPWEELPAPPITSPVTPRPQPALRSLSEAAAQLDATAPQARQQAARALGEAAASSRQDAILAVPMLGKLSKDPAPEVRLAAVEAMQQVSSARAIPLLKQALRDPDSAVVAAASAGLSRFKGTRSQDTGASNRKGTAKKRPKNR